MVLYNPYDRNFNYFRAFFEVNPSGRIEAWRENSNIRRHYYKTVGDIFRAIFEVGFVIISVFYLIIEIFEIVGEIRSVMRKFQKQKQRAENFKRKEEQRRLGRKPHLSESEQAEEQEDEADEV